MNFLPTSLAAALLLLTLPSALQTGGDKPVSPPAAPVRPVAVEEILGTWKLTSFETTNLKREKRQEVGYLLVGDEFLSFECHIGWMDDSGGSEASTFFSGTHSYELRNDSVLVMTSLIGTTMDPNGTTPVFEPVGRKREYKVKFNGARLVLLREKDQQSFQFERIAASGGGLDFYGRKKQPPKPATPPQDEDKR